MFRPHACSRKSQFSSIFRFHSTRWLHTSFCSRKVFSAKSLNRVQLARLSNGNTKPHVTARTPTNHETDDDKYWHKTSSSTGVTGPATKPLIELAKTEDDGTLLKSLKRETQVGGLLDSRAAKSETEAHTKTSSRKAGSKKLPIFGPKNRPGRPSKPRDHLLDESPPKKSTLGKTPISGPKKQKGRKKITQDEGLQPMELSATLTPGSRQQYVNKVLKHISGDRKKDKEMALDRKRVNITSENLCDDIIERLGPSLQKHRGCDIIDINPGVGIWSTKLHDYLNPRSHILMEPHQYAYSTLLEPLVKAPDSKYKLVSSSGIVWEQLERILSKEYLPFQENLDLGDPRLQLPNNTLLVTANLASYPKVPYRRFTSLANLVIHQFLSASRTHSLFHRYGKVRMLLWFNDDDLKLVVPRALATRRRAAVDAEISCGHVEVLVSSASTNDQHHHRELSTEFESVQRVLQRMQAAGTRTPPGRESQLMEDYHRQIIPTSDTFSPTYVEELEELKTRFKAGEFQKDDEERKHVRSTKGNRRELAVTDEYARMIYLQRRLTSEAKKYNLMMELADEYDSIVALELKHFRSTLQQERDQLLLEWRKRLDKWKNVMATSPEEDRFNVKYLIDQRHAYQQNPPTLFWDRREAEPLRAHKEGSDTQGDFFPNAADLALVDFQPCALSPAITNNLAENYDILDYIVQKLCWAPAQNVHDALKSLLPGAYEWLLEDCAALRDPTQGGSYDLTMIRARAMPASLIIKIVESWLRWPFRPSRVDTFRSMGAEAYDPDEEDAI